MDINQIRHLLTNYFNGVTTLEEEKLLFRYFAEESDIPPELASYRPQFNLLGSVADEKPDTAALTHKIAERIDNLVNSSQTVLPGRSLKRFLVAASIALFIGISGLVIYKIYYSGPKDTYRDPQLAYNQAEKALLYVSLQMKRGMEPLSNVSKISTGTSKLSILGKMDESMGMLNLVSFINQSSNLKK